MEEEEEKTGKIQTKRQSQSKTKMSFPVEVTSEILVRLPAKSILRFRSVSKLWSSITTDPYFIKSFETHSSTRPSLLIFSKRRDKSFVFSIPQHHQNSNEPSSSSSYLHVDSYEMPFPQCCRHYFTESVHGLVCFQDSGNPIIWNPTTRKLLTLPKPEESWKSILVLLGYDPIEGKHKVVCMPSGENCNECMVLILGSSSAQKTWRTIKTNHSHCRFYGSYAVSIRGMIYYHASNDSSVRVIIMRFDVRSEKFDIIELPENIFSSHKLLSYEGRLAFVTNSNTMTFGTTLWILEDAKKHEWSCKHFLAPLTLSVESLGFRLALNGISHAGEFIYGPSTFHGTFYVLYFDPKRNSFRLVEFEGLADEEFWLWNGFVKRRKLKSVHCLPNHIESLVSL